MKYLTKTQLGWLRTLVNRESDQAKAVIASPEALLDLGFHPGFAALYQENMESLADELTAIIVSNCKRIEIR